MDALSAFLASLGPWGVLLGAALPVIVYLIRNKGVPPAPAPNPSPAPVPAPGPDPVPSNTPILDALLAIIRARLQPPAPKSADLAHEDAAALMLKLAPPK